MIECRYVVSARKEEGAIKVRYLLKDMYEGVVTSVRACDGETRDFPIL